MTGLPLFTQWVADETNAANQVKQVLPVLVVMGNPPYSGHSANKGQWIDNLLKGKLPDGKKTGNYYEVDGSPLGERNPKWLQDDYVKFIRFGQCRIEQSGGGILAFISNHGYLDNPTFRGMRQSLMQTFSEIYMLDLHGNAKKKESAPDGSKDENVFDIMQGVAIGIFVKHPGKAGPAKIYHADLWGTRAKKYEQLFEQDAAVTAWAQLNPQTPFYLFTPQDINLLSEYYSGWKINEIFPVNSVGIVTARDKLTVRWNKEEIWDIVKNFASLPVEEARSQYQLGPDVHDWKVHLAQTDIKNSGPSQEKITPILYRPFDVRFTYYTGQTSGFHCRPRPEVMHHFCNKKNMGLITVRQVAEGVFNHTFVSKNITESRITISNKGIGFQFPLYLYPTEDAIKQNNMFETSFWPPDKSRGSRTPNLNPDFVTEMGQKLGLSFTPNAPGDLQTTVGPEDIFHYIYAIFHSPIYRIRYAEFLKIDFPRVPVTSDVEVFRSLCGLGQKLTGLHLLESPDVGQFITRYPVAGDNLVEKGYPRYAPPGQDRPGRVAINKTQYFDGVPPDVWEFYIGGYQPAQKWLKDRRGRQLSYDDLTHYQQMAAALKKTIDIMEHIDAVIQEWPMG
jgi:predicted helicase